MPMLRLTLMLLLLALAIGCGQSELKKRTLSTQHMKALYAAIQNYRDAHENNWPAALSDVQPHVGKSATVVKDKDLAGLLQNPLTGDNPGYEYVNPEGENKSPDGIILYQLRGGKRDESLLAVFHDGTIKSVKE